MPEAFPNGFREDVIRVCKESDASVAQVAKDFGISPSCLKRWLTIDERRSAGASVPAKSASESEVLREVNKRVVGHGLNPDEAKKPLDAAKAHKISQGRNGWRPVPNGTTRTWCSPQRRAPRWSRTTCAAAGIGCARSCPSRCLGFTT